MAAMAGGGWGAHGSDDFTMYRVFKFTRLPISLPGKEMDRVEVVSVRRTSVSSFQRSTMLGSRARPSTQTAELALDGMGWRGALMNQASFRLALHFT